MKKHLIILLLFMSVKLFPQQVKQEESNMNALKMAKYKSMKTNGIIMLSVGGAALVGGLAIFISNEVQLIVSQNNYQNQLNTYYIQQQTNPNSVYPTQPTNTSQILNLVGGAALATIGGLAVAGGTVMYIVNNARERKLAKRMSVVVLPNYFKVAYTF